MERCGCADHVSIVGTRDCLKQIDDGMWAVYFEGLELGVFNERKQRVYSLNTAAKPKSNN
jgi:hypothetical protein